jgi:hypothetical protein
LYDLYFRIEEYGTIDETIRAFYLNDFQDEVNIKKRAISILFYILENVHMYRDYRYKQFLLTLLDNNKKLPDNLFILSWNYDNQLEHSIDDLIQNKSNIITEKNYFKINGSSDYYKLPELSINSIQKFNFRKILQSPELIKYNKENILKIHQSTSSKYYFHGRKISL